MPPSFRRFTEAGVEDIKSRTEELAQGVSMLRPKDTISGETRLIVVGYSNGANLAASLILLPPLPRRCSSFPGDGALGARSDSRFQQSFGVYRSGSPGPAHSLGAG
jgi:hypothetical protein